MLRAAVHKLRAKTEQHRRCLMNAPALRRPTDVLAAPLRTSAELPVPRQILKPKFVICRATAVAAGRHRCVLSSTLGDIGPPRKNILRPALAIVVSCFAVGRMSSNDGRADCSTEYLPYRRCRVDVVLRAAAKTN